MDKKTLDSIGIIAEAITKVYNKVYNAVKKVIGPNGENLIEMRYNEIVTALKYTKHSKKRERLLKLKKTYEVFIDASGNERLKSELGIKSPSRFFMNADKQQMDNFIEKMNNTKK